MKKILLALATLPFLSVNALAECHTYKSPDGAMAYKIDGASVQEVGSSIEDDWPIRFPKCDVLECYAPDGADEPMLYVKARDAKAATLRFDPSEKWKVWPASCQ